LKVLKKIILITGIQSVFATILSLVDFSTTSIPISIPYININPFSSFLYLLFAYNLFFILSLIPFILIYQLSRIKYLSSFITDKFTINLVSFDITISIFLYLFILIDNLIPSQRTLAGLAISIIVLIGFIVFYILIMKVLSLLDKFKHKGLKIVYWIIVSIGLFLFLISIGNRVYLQIFPLQKDIVKRPNVIIISIDTLRKDHLSCYGYQGCDTPNIDNFARKSFVFENCISSAPHTVPSMASLITGNYPTVHCCRFVPLIPINKDIPTLPSILKLADYHTEFYTANPVLNPIRGFDTGLDLYDSFKFLGDVNFYFPKKFMDILKKALIFLGFESRVEYSDTTNWLKTKVSSRLKNISRHSPFFLWFHFLNPHGPYFPPEKYIPGNDKERQDLNSKKYHLFDTYYPEKEKDSIIKLYDGEIQYVDSALGELLQIMENENLFENTLIILTADHGEEFWEHDSRGHGHCQYPEVIRVPLMIYFPEDIFSKNNGRLNSYVSLTDIAPTILDFLNLPGKEAMQGVSLIPRIKTELTEKEDRDHLYNHPVYSENIQFPFRKDGLDGEEKSIYQDNYHLIYDFTQEQTELYDISNDVSELNDISENNDEINDNLYEKLIQWYETNLSIKEKLSPSQEIKLSEDEKEMLRGLGYVID
jgi:arylsulfatase A-like enzyme